MTEQQINLLSFYKGWDAYQALLIKALASLSPKELALRVAPHRRSVGENVAHIISGRVSNFLVMGWSWAKRGRDGSIGNMGRTGRTPEKRQRVGKWA